MTRTFTLILALTFISPWTKMDEHEFKLKCKEFVCRKVNTILNGDFDMYVHNYALKHKIIVSMCASCKKILGTKDGHGQAGVSHGVCYECMMKEYESYGFYSKMPKLLKYKIIEQEREREFRRWL